MIVKENCSQIIMNKNKNISIHFKKIYENDGE